MRKVNRYDVTSPSSLTGLRTAGARELARARTYYANPARTKSYGFTAYKGDDVRHALYALFHGKCAYCEARYEVGMPVDIEHFRPKGEVAETPGHPGYWWLAGHWENLLPSCIDCNRRRYQPTPASLASVSGVLDQQRVRGFRGILTGKESCFPISGARMAAEPLPANLPASIAAESALLINPCSDDPEEHLRFYIDRQNPLGLVYPAPTLLPGQPRPAIPIALPALSDDVAAIERAAQHAGVSVRGAVSIQIFGLNRLALVQERTRILRRLDILATLLVDVAGAADTLELLPLAATADEPARQRSVAKLRAVTARLLSEIKAMAQPDEPFASMVSAWIRTFAAELI